MNCNLVFLSFHLVKINLADPGAVDSAQKFLDNFLDVLRFFRSQRQRSDTQK